MPSPNISPPKRSFDKHKAQGLFSDVYGSLKLFTILFYCTFSYEFTNDLHSQVDRRLFDKYWNLWRRQIIRKRVSELMQKHEEKKLLSEVRGALIDSDSEDNYVRTRMRIMGILLMIVILTKMMDRGRAG